MKQDNELLLEHFENYLGAMQTELYGPNVDMPFQMLVFSGRIPPPAHCIVTYGLSRHHLRVIENKMTVRKELMICANRSYDRKALASLLLSVGLRIYQLHALNAFHSILLGSGPVLPNGNSKFEHLYLGSALSLPTAFSSCKTTSLPIHISQIIPISTAEKEFIENFGWSTFEAKVVEQSLDLFAIDTRNELFQS